MRCGGPGIGWSSRRSLRHVFLGQCRPMRSSFSPGGSAVITVLYLANPSTLGVRNAMGAGLLGAIITPKQGNKAWQDDPRIVVCLDNGCGPGKDGKQGKGWPGEAGFLSWLQGMERFGQHGENRVLFAVAPDVVGDAEATLTRSAEWLPIIRDLGFPAAFAAQDGLEHLDIPWDEFDVLFIGGSTEWKLGPAARRIVLQAKQRGKHVHMGRVNSGKRLEYATAIGCDTADGTKITFGPDINLPIVLGWDRGPGLFTLAQEAS